MSEDKKKDPKWYNDAKGFSFIDQDGGEDVYIHHSAISPEGFKVLKECSPVKFDGPKGPAVKNVVHVEINDNELSLESNAENKKKLHLKLKQKK